MKEHVTDAEMEWFRKATEAALRRAALRAREVARTRNTKIVVSRNGRIVALDPEPVSKDEQAS